MQEPCGVAPFEVENCGVGLGNKLVSRQGPGRERRFTGEGGARDVLWAVLYVINCLALFGLTGYFLVATDLLSGQAKAALEEYEAGLTLFASACVVSAIMACAWLGALATCARTLIYAALAASVFAWLAAGVALVRYGQVVAAVMCLLAVLLTFLYIWWCREEIRLTGLLMETACQCLNKRPAVYALSLGTLIPGCVVIASASLSAGVLLTTDVMNPASAMMFYVYLFFSVVWVIGVLGNVAYCTTSGVVARWYFAPVADQNRPTFCAAFIQCLTTSLGSICLGSAINAAVQTLKMIGHVMEMMARESDNAVAMLVACCVMCVINCIVSFVEFVTSYAFCYVATYGMSFCEGARSVFDLIKTTDVAPLVACDLTTTIQALAAITSGVVTAACVLGGSWNEYAEGVIDDQDFSVIGIASFVIGCVFTYAVLGPVGAACSTLLVCFAEEPLVLKTTHPAFFGVLQDAAVRCDWACLPNLFGRSQRAVESTE